MSITRYGKLIAKPSVRPDMKQPQAEIDELDDHILPLVLLCELDDTSSTDWAKGYLKMAYPGISVYQHNGVHHWKSVTQNMTLPRADRTAVVIKIRDLADLGAFKEVADSPKIEIIEIWQRTEELTVAQAAKLVDKQIEALTANDLVQEPLEDHGEGKKTSLQSFGEFFKQKQEAK